ncbi:MAG: phenylacetate--CoA ligase, partial [Campylobacteraceae bacterium]|nr:phenylacetate--CoA ligase [Campylobacteraceae bacterium]
IAHKKGYLDKLQIDIELNENIMAENISELDNLKKHIQHEMLNNLYINVDVKLVAPKSIIRSEGKAVRVIDKRRE